MKRWFPCHLLCLFVVSSWSSTVGAEDWNQWRGPSRDGFVSKGSKWPATLTSEGLEKVWSVEVGESYAGPVVSGDLVFSVETLKKKQEVVRAFDRESGAEKWSKARDGSMKVPFFAAKNGSWVRSTPAVANGKLYVAGMRDVLVCLDANSGEEQWVVDFAEREGTEIPGFGFVSSPLVKGDALYVQAGCAVSRLKVSDGSTVWRAMEDRRAMFGSAFSSPVLAKVAGHEQILAQTRSHLGGIDPATGNELWRYEVKAFRGMNILTPAPAGDLIFTATYGGGSYGFSVTEDGGEWDAEKAWAHKLEGYMTSPILRDGHAYFFGRDKRFHCVELETGEVRWASEKKFGEYWSLVANGDRILALGQRGDLLYWQATPESLKELGKVEVSPNDSTWAHLAVAGNEIFVRSLKGLTKWRWR